MKNLGRFAININTKDILFEGNEEEFKKDLYSLVGEPGYYFPHFFDDENRITNYAAIIIEKDKIERIDEVREVYGIEPTKILSDKNGIYHFIFELELGIPKADYETLSEILSYIYLGKPKQCHFYENNELYVENKLTTNSLFTKITDLKNLKAVLNYRDEERSMSKVNLQEIANINSMEISKIGNLLGKNTDKFDVTLNINPIWGRPYEYIINSFPTAGEAKEWMNTNLGTRFINEVDLTKYRGDGEKIREGKDFLLDEVGYYVIIEGEKKRQTDFFINVHFKIRKSNNETVYIVSLINPRTSERSAKIEWTNTSSKGSFCEFLQKLGNYHFFGGPNFIASMHSRISDYKDVPEIFHVYGFGFHKHIGIVIFENGIFDIKEKIFTPKTTDDDFYFNYNGKGYFVVDKQENNLSPIFKGLVPSIRGKDLVEVRDLFKIMEGLYADHSGKLAIMYALGSMGYSLFSDNQDDKYPVFFVRGLTGSGKTTYMDIMQRMWGVRDGIKAFSQTSSFTMSIWLTYLRYMPFFLSEFREGGKDNTSKTSTLRSAYDRTGQAKGRPDQTIVAYDYTAHVLIEGEEMFDDGAMRTRCIQQRFLSTHKIQGDFNTIAREGLPILDNMLYTYLCLASKEKYEQYIKEGYEEFKGLSSSSRINNNLKMVYAGCMALDDSLKDTYLKVLKYIGKFQDDDYNANSTGKQIIKAISRFLEQSSGFNEIEATRDSIVISWNAIIEYITMKRLDLSLQSESYREHLQDMGYPVQYEEVGNRMMEGVVVPKDNIPKEFLLNPIIYEIYKNNKK